MAGGLVVMVGLAVGLAVGGLGVGLATPVAFVPFFEISATTNPFSTKVVPRTEKVVVLFASVALMVDELKTAVLP